MSIDSIDSTGAGLVTSDVLMREVHDHNRPSWSGTATRTTSFTCPSDSKGLWLELHPTHANASGIWDFHVYVGTSSGGSELYAIGGNYGWVGYGAGSGTWYPIAGTYPIDISDSEKGSTLYVTSYAPAGNYYFAGLIKIYST